MLSYRRARRDTQGTEDSLERQIEALHDASVQWALACCRFDPVEAEDVLQMAYLEILEKRARFEGRSSFKSFLFGVIRSVAASRRRRRFLRALLLQRFGDALAPVPEPPGADDRAREVRAALARLSARQREVLDLVFFHEMTVEDAAAVMRIGVGSARVHYSRGKARLASLLSRAGGADALATTEGT